MRPEFWHLTMVRMMMSKRCYSVNNAEGLVFLSLQVYDKNVLTKDSHRYDCFSLLFTAFIFSMHEFRKQEGIKEISSAKQIREGLNKMLECEFL